MYTIIAYILSAVATYRMHSSYQTILSSIGVVLNRVPFSTLPLTNVYRLSSTARASINKMMCGPMADTLWGTAGNPMGSLDLGIDRFTIYLTQHVWSWSGCLL